MVFEKHGAFDFSQGVDTTRHEGENTTMSRAETKFDLNQVVQELSLLQQYEHHLRKIAVILDLAAELPKTTVNGEQIECVLLALFARSQKAIIEAKRPHGTITIRTKLKVGRIQFSITDDGVPDPPPVSRASLMKTPGEDMNLTTCAEIVQDQAGELYSWRPRHSASTTIIMDLPVDG
jgi:hypothetical protein